MAKDKFSAVWVSHSSISDWLECPRAYYLKNVYKDPKTGHKMSITAPPLSLGSAVHEVIEGLSVLPVEKRFDQSLIEKFDEVWKKYEGKKGGYFDKETENTYKEKGKEMLRRVQKNPGVLKNLAVKIQMDLPWFWLSEEDNIILCGKIDWLEYLKDEDGVKILDFKTGQGEEKDDSLQLPIYCLLASKTQNRKVMGVSYWYVAKSDTPVEKEMPDMTDVEEKILKIAKEIKLARQLNRFKCPTNGCRACQPMERVIKGEGEFVGVDDIRRDVYVLPKTEGKQAEGKVL